MNEPVRKYWFHAKRYGWGWGPPSTWQGWVFFVGWLVTFFLGTTRLARLLPTHPGFFALFVLSMATILLAVCFAKGEPPRWRWGDRDEPKG